MTIVSLVGAFALLYVAWFQMSQSSDDTDRFSILVQSSGEASDTWRKAKKLSERSREVISRMEYFKNESSDLFQFAQDMLVQVSEDIQEMKSKPEIPKDLLRSYELAFRDFNKTSVRLGTIALSSNPELFPQPDYDKVAQEFLMVIERLNSWTDEFLESEDAKIEARKAEMIESRKDSFSLIGIACVAYLLIIFAVGYVIQRSFLNPIRRMAHAADEALSEKRSFTQSSLKGSASAARTPSSTVKTLFRKETFPKRLKLFQEGFGSSCTNSRKRSKKERLNLPSERKSWSLKLKTGKNSRPTCNTLKKWRLWDKWLPVSPMKSGHRPNLPGIT